MGFVSSLLGTFGFGIGISAGIVIGYYLFIYFQPTDVKANIPNLFDFVPGHCQLLTTIPNFVFILSKPSSISFIDRS